MSLQKLTTYTALETVSEPAHLSDRHSLSLSESKANKFFYSVARVHDRAHALERQVMSALNFPREGSGPNSHLYLLSF